MIIKNTCISKIFHVSCFGFVDAPRIVQTFFTLPLNLICRGSQPVKQATHKVNPFVPNAPFLYLLCSQGVEKGCIGNKWVGEGISGISFIERKSVQNC